jgi:DinB family protein/ankyrin repeat protein
MGIKKELLELSDYAFGRLMTRLEGLTDEEYFWEPAPNCWSIRRSGDGSFRGDGGFVWDEVPPITTIAWRISHIIDCISAERCATWLGLEPEDEAIAGEFPGTAESAIALLKRANDRWHSYVTAADEQALWEKSGPIAGIYADHTRVAFVLHILDELIHHSAEVGVLRDLYRAQELRDPLIDALLAGDRTVVEDLRRADPSAIERTVAERPELMREAAATGRWAAIPLLAELGFSVDDASGRTALHHAAAAGKVDIIRLLVELGADVNAKDPIYHTTPLGWAEYFLVQNHANRAQIAEAAELLRSLTGAQAS